MNFLNKNKFFTPNQLEGVEDFLNKINAGRYNGIGRVIPGGYNMIEVGYKSGWLSFRAIEKTSGEIYCLDIENNISPTLKDTLRFNKIINRVQCDNTPNVMDSMEKILEEKNIDLIVITGLPTLEKSICNLVEGKNILVFKLTGASFTLVNGNTYEIKSPKERKPENAAWAAQREAMEKYVEERDAKEAVRVEEEATEIEKIIEDKKIALKEEGKKVTEKDETAAEPAAPKRRRRTRKTKTSE